MSDRQGFYSVIQFLPVPERFEFVNIGVVLFAPSARSVEVKIAPDYSRINRLFGQPESKLKWLTNSLENRMHTDFGAGWDRRSLEKFAALRTGHIQMSAPLPILVDQEPKVALESLFDEMVTQTPKSSRAKKAASVFKQRLVMAGVLDLVVQAPTEVPLPQGVTIKVPYAYQNGAYNLIDPVRLEGTPEEALKNASSKAVEGN